MKMMLLILAAFLILPLEAYAGICNLRPSREPQPGSGCRLDLVAEGWKEIASCVDGHTWQTIIEKNDVQKICFGINAIAGPTESPCRPFNGNIDKFKAIAAEADRQVQVRKKHYEAAYAEGRVNTKEYMDEVVLRSSAEKRINCGGDYK